MKRKYLSALLMGVLTLSSVSTFTSCKDYDDDISNLQGQIDKLATADQLSQKVAELQALISSNKSDITSLQSELAKKTTLDEVKAVLADYATKQYVNDADKTLQDAIDALKTGDIAKLKEDVVKAQAAADKAAEDAKAANADIVETLKTLATKTELKDAADAAQKAIEALESKNAEDLKKAQDAITETLKSYATKSDVQDGDKKTLESLASTIKNASDALALANTNKQAIADALDILGKGYSKENTVAAAIETIKAQIGTPNKELGTLDSRLAAIEGVLNGVKDDETKLGLVAKVTNIENKLKDIIGEYTTMVTEVSLVGSFSNGDDFNKNLVSAGIPLKYTWGDVDDDFIFGKAEKDDLNKQVPAAANQQTFVKGTTFSNKKEIVVRVNPTNAVLTKASIKLVDSQGNDLDKYLEIGEPKQFTKLLTARASNNTGLWTVPVTVKAGVAMDDIKKLSNGKEILYAVAVQNTKNAEDRYVASTYDITVPAATEFHPATDINSVKIWSVNTMGEDNAVTLGTTTNPLDKPVRVHAGDNDKTPVSAKSGENIKISFKGLADKIKYFYVVRDDSHVDKETSGSSAINAWNSYKYDGSAYGKVVEVNPSDPTGTINVTINGQVGDAIGFRIFAANYDGTLTPGSGKSFVVYVGENQNQASVAGELIPVASTNNETGWLPLNGKLKNGVKALSTTGATKVNGKDINFTVAYSTDGVNAVTDWSHTNMSDVKFVKFTCTTAMTDWKDDAKASFVLSTKNATTGMVENEISVALTKKLPDAAYTKNKYKYTWKDEQLVNGKYTAYVYPTTGWTTATSDATKGYQDLTQAITGLTPKFNITIDKIAIDGDGNYTKSETVNPAVTTKTTGNVTSCNVSVAKSLIDGTTPHETTISYNYGAISTDHKDAIGNYVVKLETVQTVFACPLTADVQKYTWKQWSKTENKVTTIKDVNVLTYGNPATVENVNLLEYILGKNSYDNTIFGGTLKDLLYGRSAAGTVPAFAQKYVTIEDVKLVSAGSGKADYFKAEIDGDELKFKSQSGTSNPVNDVKSYLKFTLVDAFGHKTPVTLDFTVKRAQ